MVHWTRDACELFRGKQLTDFFVPLSAVSLSGDLCNGKPWWVYWLSESFCLLHFLSWSFSHDLYCSKRTAQNFWTFAAASIPVVLNLSWQGKFWPQKAELALVTHPFQVVLADWSWESEAYLTRGNLLLCRQNIHIQICSHCLLVLQSSAPQLFLLHFILPCRRQLSGCHLSPDTCWNETCCSSPDPACLEHRFNLESRLQGT